MATGPVVCTLTSSTRARHARVIGARLRTHWPTVTFAVGVVDAHALPPHSIDADLIVSLAQISPGSAHEMVRAHGERELIYATTPFLLRYLLSLGYGPVVFLKEETFIVGSLDNLCDAASRHAVTLTPHFLSWPSGAMAAERREAVSLSGIVNGGVVCVSDAPSTHAFLEWWASRVEERCVWDPAEGLHFEQRWLDLATTMFDDVVLLDDPGVNIGHWNLPERPLTAVGEGYATHGAPVSVVRFSGFDETRPTLATSYFPDGLRVDDMGGTARVYAEYAAELASCTTSHVPPYGWTNDDDETDPHRPDFWLKVHALRPDVSAAFPDPTGADAVAFAEWTREHGSREYGVNPPREGRT